MWLGAIELAGCSGRSGLTKPVSPSLGQAAGADSAKPAQDPTSVIGRVDAVALNRFMNRQNPRLQACYNRELVSEPDLTGRIQVEFVLGASGEMLDVRLRGNELNEPMGECVLNEVRSWAMGPVVTGGTVTVRRTYLFEPGE